MTTFKYGDILVRGEQKRKVLGVVNEVIIVSMIDALYKSSEC